MPRWAGLALYSLALLLKFWAEAGRDEETFIEHLLCSVLDTAISIFTCGKQIWDELPKHIKLDVRQPVQGPEGSFALPPVDSPFVLENT